MRVTIELKNGEIAIILRSGRKVLDQVSFAEERSVSERLLPELDRLLKKNDLQVQDIEKFILRSEIPESYTTHRIAKTVVNGLNAAKAGLI